MMALGLLNMMVPHLALYLRYWWNKVNFSSARITFDRLYTPIGHVWSWRGCGDSFLFPPNCGTHAVCLPHPAAFKNSGRQVWVVGSVKKGLFWVESLQRTPTILIRWRLVYWTQWYTFVPVSQILMEWTQFVVHQDNIWQTLFLGAWLKDIEQPKFKSYTFNAFRVNFLIGKPSFKHHMFHLYFCIDPNLVFSHWKNKWI